MITGLAIDPRKISEIVGVVKAYTTRVGGGKQIQGDRAAAVEDIIEADIWFQVHSQQKI